MLPWKTYRSLYFRTLSDACVTDTRLTNGKNKNVMAFIRAGVELGISLFVVLFYLKRRHQALKDGSSKAASFMVLPSYAFILYWIVFLQAIHIVTVSLRAYHFEDERDNNIMGNITLVIRFFYAILDDGIIASVVVLLHRRGSGILAIRQSLRTGHMLGFLATMSFWFAIPLSQYYPLVAKWIEFGSNCLFMIVIFLLLFTPPQMLPRLLGFRRSSVIPLLRFLAFGVFIATLCNVIELFVDAGNGNAVIGNGNKNLGTCVGYCNDLVFNAVWPLAVYLCLRNDSNYWRGISNSAFLQRWIRGQNTDSDAALAGGTTLQGSVNTILRVNEDGTDRNLGMLLADRIHSLPVTLPHLDFAYLKMDVSTPLIGSGGSARVFNAKYKGQSVALKMVWCVELDEMIITDFCRECALIASMPPHPNVLHSLGLCIFPPVLCLVTPLCISDLFQLVHPPASPSLNVKGPSSALDRDSVSRMSFGSTWRSMKSRLMSTNHHSPSANFPLDLKKKQAESAWISACQRNSFDRDSNEFGSDFDDFEEEISESGRRSLFVPMSKLKAITQLRPSFVAENSKATFDSSGSSGGKSRVGFVDDHPDLEEQPKRDVYKTEKNLSVENRSTSVGLFGFRNWNPKNQKHRKELFQSSSSTSSVSDKEISQGSKDWSDTMQLCVDACAAVAFLHEAKIVHGDIKSPNFLIRGAVEHSLSVAKSLMGNSIQSKLSQITQGFSAAATAKANEAVMIASSNISSVEVPNAKYRLVIADLGNSQRVEDKPEDDGQLDTRTISMAAIEGSEVMTPQWSPPEILLQNRSPSFSADIYSLAVVLFEILTNQIPFDGVVASEIIKQVREGVRVPFPLTPPDNLPENIVNIQMFHKFWTLISQSLSDSPHVRPLAVDLLASAKASVVVPDQSEPSEAASTVDSGGSKSLFYNMARYSLRPPSSQQHPSPSSESALRVVEEVDNALSSLSFASDQGCMAQPQEEVKKEVNEEKEDPLTSDQPHSFSPLISDVGMGDKLHTNPLMGGTDI